MQRSLILYILATTLLTSCVSSASQESSADSSSVITGARNEAVKQIGADTTSLVSDSTTLRPQAGPYSPECYKAITDIVLSSSFKSDDAKKENIKVRIDRQINSKLIIQLFASEKDHESTLGWLRLDKANEKLEDITIDPDKPVLLDYDKTLISALRQHCP
ncbi:hypothetical protein SAMN05518672_101740 [Chitinophaga sp. CF118]|uniref:hypothetical protein n=1 Tax=Chitinophaga sp. CF118 TaxID=1884367 RepID=UPI0008E7CD12|nr:hypothetical protein [Chitinophaga sp. CF118]SFD14872.1 hypothetical protein SAMN05518672_101740 [Chitinophaga sp. CF118]